jgi:hypothetical protein
MRFTFSLFGLILVLSSFRPTTSDWICEEQKHLYCIEVINTRSQVALPSTICGVIEEYRKPSEDSYYTINRNLRIHILSDANIKAGKRFEEQIVYITE